MEKVVKNGPVLAKPASPETNESTKTLAPPQFKLETSPAGGAGAAAGGATQMKTEGAAAAPANAEKTQLQLLDEALDKWNVPEEKVISICGKLLPIEKIMVMTTPSYRQKFVDSMNRDEMTRAVKNLDFPLSMQLDWIAAADGITIPFASGDFFANLEAADDAGRASLRSNKVAIDVLYQLLSPADFARMAARVILVAPANCVDREAARQTAWTMLTVQLANKEIAKTTLNGSLTPVIIPRNKLLTDLPQFAALAGTKTFDGRPWEPTRGVGYGTFVAMAEENLLGGACTATFNGAVVNGTYDTGYSTASHEFAHGMHDNVLSSADQKIISDAYKARKTLAKAALTDTDQWVDGKEGCYASQTDHEFFAQLSNAYLGTNTGSDPNTRDARHNGKDWVKTHEPTVFALLEKMYAGGNISGANPAVATPAAPTTPPASPTPAAP
jgi:hypothetical protein